MQKNFSVVKKYVNLILDIVLGILGVFLLVFMASYLVDLATYLMKPMTPDNFFSYHARNYFILYVI